MKLEGKLVFKAVNAGSKSENKKAVCIVTDSGTYRIQQQGAAIRNPALEKMVGNVVKVEGIIKETKLFTNALPVIVKTDRK